MIAFESALDAYSRPVESAESWLSNPARKSAGGRSSGSAQLAVYYIISRLWIVMNFVLDMGCFWLNISIEDKSLQSNAWAAWKQRKAEYIAFVGWVVTSWASLHPKVEQARMPVRTRKSVRKAKWETGQTHRRQDSKAIV